MLPTTGRPTNFEQREIIADTIMQTRVEAAGLEGSPFSRSLSYYALLSSDVYSPIRACDCFNNCVIVIFPFVDRTLSNRS